MIMNDSKPSFGLIRPQALSGSEIAEDVESSGIKSMDSDVLEYFARVLTTGRSISSC